MRRYTIRAPRVVELTHQAFRLAVSRLSSRLVQSLQVLKSRFSLNFDQLIDREPA